MTNTSRRLSWLRLVVPLTALLPACRSPDEVPPTLLLGDDDGGNVGRSVTDAGMKTDAPARDGVVTDVSAETGNMIDGGDAPVASVAKVTVTVEKPAKGSVVVRSMGFRPSVTISIESIMMLPVDRIGDVTVSIIDGVTKAVVATGKLNQTTSRTLPGGSGMIYGFADTLVDVAKLGSGSYDLAVSAKTAGGIEGIGMTSFLLDAGPTIRFEFPADGKSYHNAAPLSVDISDELFSPLSNVSMSIGQSRVSFTKPANPMDTQYMGTIDFMAFNPPLDGDLILTVSAINKNGTETTAQRRFISDNRGPVFKNASPAEGELVGRVMPLSVEVLDAAGVVDSAVVAVVAHGDSKFVVRLNPPAAGATAARYTGVFDTTQLSDNAIFPTVSFRAVDKLGNESSLGYTLGVDNMPPLSDLDPPDDLRVETKEQGQYICSWPFDPVGPDAVDDGALVNQLFDIRVRIEDQGNVPLAGTIDFTPIAGVEEGRAQLLILDDTTQPLVVDSLRPQRPVDPANPTKEVLDGYCDMINPLLTPTSNPKSASDALLINLVPVPPGGSGDFRYGDVLSCSQGKGTQPASLCETTGNSGKTVWQTSVAASFPAIPHSDTLTVSIGYGANGKSAPSIWSIGPVVSDGLQCAGRQFDALGNRVTDGWACLAVAATDRFGSMQVSRPLRVCIDQDNSDHKWETQPGGQPPAQFDCPHKLVAAVSSGTPMVVETKTEHGLADGDEAVLVNVNRQTRANGRWKVKKLDAKRVQLIGSAGQPPGLCFDLGVGNAGLADCATSELTLRPGAPIQAELASSYPFSWLVKRGFEAGMAGMPDRYPVKSVTLVTNAIITGAIDIPGAASRWVELLLFDDNGASVAPPIPDPVNPGPLNSNGLELITRPVRKFTLVRDYLGRASVGSYIEAQTGTLVGAGGLPNCTGVVVEKGSPPKIKSGTEAGKTYSCKPWRLFPRGEHRRL